jgi:SAM-dependent methyltransferase
MKKSSPYTLNLGPREIEIQRLNNQHDILFQLTGQEHLPVVIKEWALSVSRPIRIADVGTGTGIWLSHTASCLASETELTGFDITSKTFPDPRSSNPLSIDFIVHDMLEAFPKEHIGRYDIVHVRMLVFAFKKEQWPSVVRNLSTLVRPGGWLFWEETGYPLWNTLPPSNAWADFWRVEQDWAEKKGRDMRSVVSILQFSLESDTMRNH